MSTKKNAPKLSLDAPTPKREKASSAENEARLLATGARKRLTLDMSPETHKRIKKLAADAGVSMRDFIMQTLREQHGIRD